MSKRKTFEQILHEKMFGYSLGGKEPIQNFIVRDVGKDFRKAIKPLAPVFKDMVETQAEAHGLGSYTKYLWWVLYQKRSLWPTLEKKEKIALNLGRELVSVESMIPRYDQERVTPPADLEPAVQATLKAVAKQAKKKFAMEGARAFMGAVRKNAPRLHRAYPKKFTSLPAVQITLMGFVKTAIDRYPGWFDNQYLQMLFINVFLSPK